MRRSRALPEQLTSFGDGFSSIKKREAKKGSTEMLQGEELMTGKKHFRIYSNKRRGAYLIFPATNVALGRGRRLFEGLP